MTVPMARSCGRATGRVRRSGDIIKDLTPGFAGSDLRELANVEGTVYFIVEGVLLWALWKSDGSAAGTVRVSNFAGRMIASAGGSLYFLADDGIHGTELWGSDGTAAGTQMLKDVRPVVPA